MKNQFYCVKDNDDTLRPRAGIWRADHMGKDESNEWLASSKGKDCTIVLVEIVEIK